MNMQTSVQEQSLLRSLPVVMAQVAPRAGAEGLEHLGDEVAAIRDEFPATRLVLYPEYHTCPVSGGPKERPREYEAMAEPLDGPRVSRLRRIARTAGVWLQPGTVVERGDDGKIYNTAVVIDPNGDLVASYRKMFPWRPFEPFRPGNEFVVFDIPRLGRFGLCICYDLWYPEVIRHLAWLGADVILCPTHTSTSDRAQELVLARAAAIQNQVYVIATNSAAPVGTGRSILVDPEGHVRVQAPSENPALLTDVVDLGAVARVRALGTCGLNRMWSQFRSDDPVLPMPLYRGEIHPHRWHPATREQGEA
jgi:predicted amidohydrolase